MAITWRRPLISECQFTHEPPLAWIRLFGLRVLLLVLSIAVLVLVLDWILRHTIGQHAPPCSMVESVTSAIRVGVRVPLR